MELNSYILQKVGWFMYSTGSGLGSGLNSIFQNDKWVRFFHIDGDTVFIIKEMTPKEKQKTKKEYKFIKFSIEETYKNNCIKSIIDEFSTNQELFKLILDNGAMAPSYKRHFSINKIIK